MNKNETHWLNSMTDEERPAYERAKEIIDSPNSSAHARRNALEMVSFINRWCIKRMKDANNKQNVTSQ